MELTRTTVTAPAIHCQGCATAAQSAVSRLPGVSGVEVDVPSKTVTVTHSAALTPDRVKEVLSRAGFPSV